MEMFSARCCILSFFIHCNHHNSSSLHTFLQLTYYPSTFCFSPLIPFSLPLILSLSLFFYIFLTPIPSSSPLYFAFSFRLLLSYHTRTTLTPQVLYITCTTSHTPDDDDTHAQSSSISSSRRARALEARKSIIVSTVDGSIKYRSWEFDPRSHRTSGDC